jgi:hypothetical protein
MLQMLQSQNYGLQQLTKVEGSIALHGLCDAGYNTSCDAGYNTSCDAGYITSPELSKVLKLERNPLKV